MPRIVQIPISVKQAAFSIHLMKKRRRRIRRQDVKRGALEAIFLDPISGSDEHVLAVVIETQHEGTVHLNSVVVQHSHPASVVRRLRYLLVRRSQVVVAERPGPNEDSGTARQRHVPNQSGFSVTSTVTAALQILLSGLNAAHSAQMVFARTKIVVDEDRTRLVIRLELVGHLLGMPHAVRHAQTPAWFMSPIH